MGDTMKHCAFCATPMEEAEVRLLGCKWICPACLELWWNDELEEKDAVSV